MEKFEFPKASEEDKKLGWKISYEFLESIQEEIGNCDESPSLEDIELVLLAVQKKLSR